MNEFGNIDYQLPYNPNDVDIRQQRFAVREIMEMITESEIELWREDDYQRKSNAWDPKRKSRLIESLIMRIPLPIFYFDGSNSPWKVIDGLHRLTTLYTFIKGESFPLSDLEYLKDLEGSTFFELPFKYRRVIETFNIEAYLINPGTPDKVKLNIFKRINTGGISMSSHEIRTTYFSGKPVEFIKSLVLSAEFLNTTKRKISNYGLKDHEAVLRFFSFYKYWENYKPSMEQFLDFSMETIYTISEIELKQIRERFRQSMITCNVIFDDKAFYMLNYKGEKLGSTINMALFETWSVNIALLDYDALEILETRKEELLIKYFALFQNVEFNKSVSSGTSSKKSVYTRFALIKELINEMINAN